MDAPQEPGDQVNERSGYEQDDEQCLLSMSKPGYRDPTSRLDRVLRGWVSGHAERQTTRWRIVTRRDARDTQAMESVTPSRDCWREFDVAVARWRLGDLLAERLPAAALGALIAGCETPSLAQLAAMDGAGWSEIEPLVGRVLDERSRAVPTTRGGCEVRSGRSCCVRMVDGEVTPEEGTERTSAAVDQDD